MFRLGRVDIAVASFIELQTNFFLDEPAALIEVHMKVLR